MVDNSLDKRFFTNTYVTSSGRGNYLRADYLEDPLFTGFTFDIDFVSSPLFYTIFYSDYGYPNVEGMGDKIESALAKMYYDNISFDEGYQILPQFSASILDDNKLGFGLQQNVYTDMPLYGATEYIYMVDKRNGGTNQNDVRYDSNKFVEYGGDPNALNGIRLGESIKDIVNESDKAWAEKRIEQNKQHISDCEDMLEDESVKNEHEMNENAMKDAEADCEELSKITFVRYGETVTLNEKELEQKIQEHKDFQNSYQSFKYDIADWVNGELKKYKNEAIDAYNNNEYVKNYFLNGDPNNEDRYRYDEGMKEHVFGDNGFLSKLIDIYNRFETHNHYVFDNKGYNKRDDGDSFVVNLKSQDGLSQVRDKHIVNALKDELNKFGLYNNENNTSYITVKVKSTNDAPSWVDKIYKYLKNVQFISNFKNENLLNGEYFSDRVNIKGLQDDIKWMMGAICEKNLINFADSPTIQAHIEEKEKCDYYLNEVKATLYGFDGDAPRDKSNPAPDSPYGQYLKAKDIYENDDFSQATNSLAVSKSSNNELVNMLSTYNINNDIVDNEHNKSVQQDVQPLTADRTTSVVVAQTVLDMLGFISGMKKMTRDYPYVIQGVSGLDVAYNKHYGIKDPYWGSGDDKITLTCLESLDLRVSSMFNRYFNAVYDRQYRRERVPVNLRRFNCTIYVHDIRNFVSRMRVDENGNRKVSYNKVLELTDMYYSVIEFRFYDCEIVPDETGNIFNDISNEAPSDMKKTTFTFTYGNCVVNFVPPSEVAAHNAKN